MILDSYHYNIGFKFDHWSSNPYSLWTDVTGSATEDVIQKPSLMRLLRRLLYKGVWDGKPRHILIHQTFCDEM